MTVAGPARAALTGRQKAAVLYMALGAEAMMVTCAMLGRVALLVGAGIVLGGLLSWWATRYIASMLYGLTPHDPLTLTGAAIVLAGVGALAGWLPARRAARIDPAQALRDQ